MTFTFPARAAQPRPMAAELLDELELISNQAEAVAAALAGLCLDPHSLEAVEAGSAFRAQVSCCRLETAAQHLRHLAP